MKEVTRVLTVQITNIKAIEDWQVNNLAEERKEEARAIEFVYRFLGVDNVVVTSVKDFVRDEDEQR